VEAHELMTIVTDLPGMPVVLPMLLVLDGYVPVTFEHI
jgi:hypothetical protein